MFEIYFSYFQRQPIPSIPVFLSLIPIFLIWQRKAYHDKTFLIFLIYLVTKFIIDLLMFDGAAHRENTVLLYNLSIAMRYVLLSWMYYLKIEIKSHKVWVVIIMPLFVLFTIWDLTSANPGKWDLRNHNMVRYASTIESLLILFWILLYFFDIIRSLKIPNLLEYPFFWICSGLLLYYSSLLFIAPVLHYASKWDNWLEIGILYDIPNIFEFVSIILFSLGIYQFPKKWYAK